jgi:hypothetical protein
MVSTFWLCFVPLFVAVDAIGMLPIFVGMMGNADRNACKRAVYISVLTAMIVALLFLFVGEVVLRFLGITVGDFMIAGGIILFLISIKDLLTVEKQTLDTPFTRRTWTGAARCPFNCWTGCAYDNYASCQRIRIPGNHSCYCFKCFVSRNALFLFRLYNEISRKFRYKDNV